ncbi:hypothetical protein DFH06DRAFT_1484980 [Mycena polygramma]|nr:hypothetical protein DFH06DRAFT_1484980 [Mycena polygramma]
MPHKKAKRSIRDQQRSQKGTDLAPTRNAGGDALSSEPLPKSFMRAINATQVRADFHAKRKLQGEDGEDGEQKKAKRRKVEGGVDAKIRPGETLAHFNKRIETDMRPLVRSAVQSSLATLRAHKKPAVDSTPRLCIHTKTTPQSKTTANPKSKSKSTNDDADIPAPVDKHASRPKEFARTSSAAPCRLNDIALAPPILSLGRKSPSSSANTPANTKPGKRTKHSVLSPAQQLQIQMAAAREAAVPERQPIPKAHMASKYDSRLAIDLVIGSSANCCHPTVRFVFFHSLFHLYSALGAAAALVLRLRARTGRELFGVVGRIAYTPGPGEGDEAPSRKDKGCSAGDACTLRSSMHEAATVCCCECPRASQIRSAGLCVRGLQAPGTYVLRHMGMRGGAIARRCGATPPGLRFRAGEIRGARAKAEACLCPPCGVLCSPPSVAFSRMGSDADGPRTCAAARAPEYVLRRRHFGRRHTREGS